MKDLLPHIDRWLPAGKKVAVARVVGVEGSGPRDPGAALIVNDDGEVFGSVSGGCVEGAVVTECEQVLRGEPARLVTYGIADEEAFSVGLTCGGTIHVLIEPLDWGPLYDGLRATLRGEQPAALATVVDGPALGTRLLVRPGDDAVGSLGDPLLDDVVERDALGQLEVARTGTRHYGPHGEARQDDLSIFIETFAPAPHMVVFGAVDFTAALVRVAKVLGYRVTVCDARSVFATKQRFPGADEVVVDWPDRFLRERLSPELTPRDAVVVLTHDHKFDVPALVAALETRAGYIGAMGSRRTTAQRNQRLREAGVDDTGLARIMAPLGLDLGARTPEETAISICGEIIRLRTGHSGHSLSESDAAIHAPPTGAPHEQAPTGSR